MTIGAAFYQFFSGFGLAAYHRDSVPQDAAFPYITYHYQVGDFDSGTDAVVECNVWYQTEEEAVPNAKADEIFTAIGRGGTLLKIDGGHIWLKRGTPGWYALQDDNPDIKRRIINISAEYLR